MFLYLSQISIIIEKDISLLIDVGKYQSIKGVARVFSNTFTKNCALDILILAADKSNRTNLV